MNRSIINPSNNEVIKFTTKVDEFTNNRDIKNLEKSIEDGEKLLLNSELNNFSKGSLYYSIATILADLKELEGKYNTEETEEKIIFFYRKSIEFINKPGITKLNKPYYVGFKLGLYTNYGNILNRVGRIIKSIEYYQEAIISIDKKNPMSEGNIGISYMTYSQLVYDAYHNNIFNYFAFHYLSSALSQKDQLESQSVDVFSKYLSYYDENLDAKENFLKKELKLNEYSLGETEEEITYRKWVLRNKLYINPMNDLPIVESFIAQDILHLPDMQIKSKNYYKFHSMFNNLKQEYIFARFNYFESIKLIDKVHFADKENYLIDTLDYSIFSIRLEKLKISYRSLYSIFDKVAYFLNEYFDLGIRERDINFRSIWRSKKEGKNGYDYKNILPYQDNMSLKGIYWIFKDLFVPQYTSTSPYAEEYNILRNTLEHKFANIYLDEFYDIERNKNYKNKETDISEETLKNYTFELLKIVRETLIYLSLSIHKNEKEKKTNNNNTYIPIGMYKLKDEWKL